MILASIGWLANVLLVIALVGIGRRWRPAFLFQFAGELMWASKSYAIGAWDMLAICVIFAGLSIAGFVQWGRK